MSRGNSRRRLLAEMNVVPYIDVMLVLVVILMVAAPYVNPSIVDLPKVHKAAKTPDTIVEVVVAPDGKLSIKDKKTLCRLTSRRLLQLLSLCRKTELRSQLSLPQTRQLPTRKLLML